MISQKPTLDDDMLAQEPPDLERRMTKNASLLKLLVPIKSSEDFEGAPAPPTHAQAHALLSLPLAMQRPPSYYTRHNSSYTPPVVPESDKVSTETLVSQKSLQKSSKGNGCGMPSNTSKMCSTKSPRSSNKVHTDQIETASMFINTDKNGLTKPHYLKSIVKNKDKSKIPSVVASLQPSQKEKVDMTSPSVACRTSNVARHVPRDFKQIPSIHEYADHIQRMRITKGSASAYTMVRRCLNTQKTDLKRLRKEKENELRIKSIVWEFLQEYKSTYKTSDSDDHIIYPTFSVRLAMGKFLMSYDLTNQERLKADLMMESVIEDFNAKTNLQLVNRTFDDKSNMTNIKKTSSLAAHKANETGNDEISPIKWVTSQATAKPTTSTTSSKFIRRRRENFGKPTYRDFEQSTSRFVRRHWRAMEEGRWAVSREDSNSFLREQKRIYLTMYAGASQDLKWDLSNNPFIY